MIAKFTTDTHLERLRERAQQFGYDVGEGHCLNCGKQLTETDVEAQECGGCSSGLDSDEGADEHLWSEDGE